MRNGLAAVAALIISIVTVSAPAVARNDGRYPTDSATKEWFDGASSERSRDCCKESDGVKEGTTREGNGTFVEWEHRRGEVWAKIIPDAATAEKALAMVTNEGWVKITPDMMVKKPSSPTAKPPGFAIVWFSWDRELNGKRTANVKCFEKGSLASRHAPRFAQH